MTIGHLLLAGVAVSLGSLAPGYAAAPPAGRVVAPPGCDARLSLTLQPGFHLDQSTWQVPGTFQPPADAPPGPIILQLPLYPGATPTTHVFGARFLSYPANLYLKSGTAAFQVPAELATVESWYRQSFSACGYVYAGGTGHTAQGVGLWFRSTSSQDVTPWVVLEPNPAGGTFVLYVGEVIDRPPRPRDSYVPPDIVRLQLRYTPPTTPEPPYPVERFTIHRRANMDQIVTAINALTDVAGGSVMGCTWTGTTTLAQLRFVRRGGKVVTVRVQPGCALVIVGHSRPLIDGLANAYFPVWNSIKQTVAACQTKRC